MRHAIIVVGSEEQRRQAPPDILLRDNGSLRTSTWFACGDQEQPAKLLDDSPNFALRFMRGLGLGYRFYQYVHGTKLWSGKRPLILVRGRSLTSRVAAYAGTWGGGDVVKADQRDEPPLGPTRFLVDSDGYLKIRAD